MTQAVLVQHVTKTFPVCEHSQNDRISDGRFYALRDISLGITQGSCTIVAGCNGSGKTLLMEIIAGLEEPTEGRVDVNGAVGLVFQEAESQILGESAREDVALSVRQCIAKERPHVDKLANQIANQISNKLTKRQDRKKYENELVETFLDKCGLLYAADFPARFLSGGEKRRLAVAGVLALGADIVIFDEPYANLDYGGVLSVNRLIIDLREKQKTVIILTHEIEKCAGLADSFVTLYKGEIVFEGRPEEALAKDLEVWGIHNPLTAPKSVAELVWL
jgi:biotin transport system ATP-binding protein